MVSTEEVVVTTEEVVVTIEEVVTPEGEIVVGEVDVMVPEDEDPGGGELPSRVVRYQLLAGSPKHSPTGTAGQISSQTDQRIWKQSSELTRQSSGLK